MSASGMCYLSSLLGQRSGNRGLCAQPCRLNFQCNGREHALSLKDLSVVSQLAELAAVGVTSAKIEGRMKRPEYVAAAVQACRTARDGRIPDTTKLQAVFSRSGFTDGYLKGSRNTSMFGYRGKQDVTSAQGVLKNLENLYKDDIHPLGVKMALTLEKEKPAKLELCSENKRAIVFGEAPEEPRNAPLPKEIAERNLSKLGNTSFYAESIDFKGTVEQWNAVSLEDDWYQFSNIVKIICVDGVVTIDD
jgi:putative protease